MESEKVKEIKKALWCCTTEELLRPCEECPYTHNCNCEVTLHSNILTLINELEKENARLLNSVETVQSGRCVYKCVLTKEHLTKFAERLKGKFEHCVGDIYHADTIDERIDKTLKEFLEEKQ